MPHLVAVACLTALASHATPGAGASEPTTAELLDQIEHLRREVEQLKAGPDAEARGVAPVDPGQDSPAVTADAATDRRTRSEAARLSGWDGRFILRSEDGNFELSPYAQLQVRHTTNINNRVNDAGTGTDDLSSTDFGWELRRTRIGLRGHLFTPDFRYDLRVDLREDSAILQNAYLDFTPLESGSGLRIGQWKNTTYREEALSASRLVAGERSLANNTIGGGTTRFVQGIGVFYNVDRLRTFAAYTDGAGSANSNFLPPPNQALVNFGFDRVEFGFEGRVDYLALGDDESVLTDFSARRTEQPTLNVGGGFAYTAGGDARILGHTLDAQYELPTGLAFYAAYLGQHVHNAGGDSFNVGGVLQASQSLGESNWEVFGRYSFVVFDDALPAAGFVNDPVPGAGDEDFFHEVTVGVNKYFRSHNLKMTIDLNWLPAGNPNVVGPGTGAGYRANEGGFGDQVSIRGQIQVLL